MANELSRTSSRTPALNFNVARLITAALSGSVCDGSTGYKTALEKALSDGERNLLIARQKELLASFHDHDVGIIATAVADMLDSYDVARQRVKTKTERKQIVTTYVRELKGIPTWAVLTACERIRMGTAGDISHQYEPTTIQLRVLALEIAKPFKTESLNITSLLGAVVYEKPVSEEMRQRVGGLLQDLAGEMRARLEAEYQERIGKESVTLKAANAAAIERDWRANGEEPLRAGDVLISRQLRDQLAARKDLL